MEAKEKGQAKEREPRVAPGQSLKPAATDVFQRRMRRGWRNSQ